MPGNGLLEHDFFYAGESKDRKMYIVRKGQVVWSYDDPAGKGEISDAVLLSNGNVLLAHQFAVKEISQDKKVLWNYDAPAGSEIHTAIPVGKDHVLFIQNGDPAMLKVVNIVTGETRKQFPLPVRNPKSVHGQFRHARLTAAGTVMVAHMDLGKVCEYDSDGKELWSVAAPACVGRDAAEERQPSHRRPLRRAARWTEADKTPGRSPARRCGLQAAESSACLAAFQRQYHIRQLGNPACRHYRSNQTPRAGAGSDSRQEGSLGPVRSWTDQISAPRPRFKFWMSRNRSRT